MSITYKLMDKKQYSYGIVSGFIRSNYQTAPDWLRLEHRAQRADQRGNCRSKAGNGNYLKF